MLEATTLRGDCKISALLDERRAEDRYHCRIRSLCRQVAEQENGEVDATWGVAEVIDISMRGMGLSLPFRAAPGSVIALVPLIGSWRPEWILRARVTNMRPDAEQGWFIGCEFVDPLNEAQFNILLRNSA